MLSSKTTTYKRSKDGCLSCKRLRIKCSEQKPSCKHCIKTKKVCDYPSEGYNTQDIDLSKLTIVSAKNLLCLSDFQYQLLNFHLNYGSSIISQNDPTAYRVWHEEIPALFSRSPLVRKSLYTMSSLTMWSMYDLETIHTISYRDNGSTIYLYCETEKTFSDLMGVLSKIELNDHIENDFPIVFGFICLVTFISYHPSPSIPLVEFSNSTYLDLFSISKVMSTVIWRTTALLQNTFMGVVPLLWREILTRKGSYQIPIFGHLKWFITNEESFILKKHYKSYLTVMNRMSVAVNMSFENHSLTIFSISLPILITDMEEFSYDLRNKDYAAMKIIFYYSAITLLLGLVVNHQSSIWSEYMTNFINMWPNKDWYDHWLYDLIVVDGYRIHKSNLDHLKELGNESGFVANSICY